MIPESVKYDLLCVGHVCHDLLDDKYILGGSVSYASAFAHSIHKTSAIITSFGKEFQYADFFHKRHLELINEPSDSTTIFQNVYIGDDRWQYLRGRAGELSNTSIIENSKRANVLLLCPVADEIDPAVLIHLSNSIIGVTIQGWLRQWDSEGKVKPKSMDWELLRNADFIFLSYEDLGIKKEIDLQLIELGNTVIITNEHMGADIYRNGKVISLPSWPTDVVDPTGAGDTFATAFLLEYAASQNLKSSAISAHCAASLIIEQRGMDYENMSYKMEDRITAYKQKFGY